MADTIYLKVKNWERFQQYKDGRPLRWIKLYVKLLGDWEFEQLPEVTQLRLMKLWLVAAERDNRIPCDPAWIERRIGARSPVDVLTMVEDGWLGVHDPHDVENVRKVLSDRDVQSRTKGGTGDVRFTRSREERRGEERRGTEGSSLRSSPSGEDAAVENSRETKNKWGPTVTACQEHVWLGPDPPRGRSRGQELSVAKQLAGRWNASPDEIALACEGFGRLRDRGYFEGWIEPKEPACLLALNRTPEDENGIPVYVRSLHEMRKNGAESLTA